MNYLREARNHLQYYGDLQNSIENMDREISRLVRKAGPKDITAITYDSDKVQSGGHDEALDALFKIQALSNSREETKEKLKEIEELLDKLEEEYQFYGKVLRKWYLERMAKEDIAQEIGYSSRTSIYSLEGKAIRVFAVRLFGIEALKIM